MRKRISFIVLLAALSLDLAWAPPAPAQALGDYEVTIVDQTSAKRMRRKRQIYTLAGSIVVAILGGIFITLNVLDKRAAQRKLQEKFREQERMGMM